MTSQIQPVFDPAELKIDRTDFIYDISSERIKDLGEKDMMLGVGSSRRDAKGSVAVRRFIARYKKLHRQARKAKTCGIGISKQDIVVRIVLGLKLHGYRIIGEDRRECSFEIAYDKVWKIVRDVKRLTLADEECASNLDDLPPSPGRENVFTFTMPHEGDDFLCDLSLARQRLERGSASEGTDEGDSTSELDKSLDRILNDASKFSKLQDFSTCGDSDTSTSSWGETIIAL